MILSIRLERHASTAEILALYLNQIYLGSGAYGVETAAPEYFGKPATELLLAEATLGAGLPSAPSRYSRRRHFERAEFRQRYVLERMLEEQSYPTPKPWRLGKRGSLSAALDRRCPLPGRHTL